MATFEQVVTHLEGMGFTFDERGWWYGEVEWEDGRDQGVFIRIWNSDNDLYDAMIVDSIFASQEDITPKKALELAEGYQHGIAMRGEAFVVRDSVPIADVDESEVMSAIQSVALIADILESELGGDDF